MNKFIGTPIDVEKFLQNQSRCPHCNCWSTTYLKQNVCCNNCKRTFEYQLRPETRCTLTWEHSHDL